MSKISVKGDDMDALYKWLTQKSENGQADAEVQWNFQKFMIDENGNWVDFVAPKESPLSDKIVQWIEGKGYELLSLFFNRNEDPNAEQCPFLVDEENVLKIKKAKEIIIANMAEPPGLQELADTIGLNLKKLKMGFKQIYGDTVYGFLFDYKMDYARQLLDSGSYNVNEVGLKIGYSTGSHFIAAFKKKFGTTPKKYLMAINTTMS
jgi:AraC-like DNA-binding protein